MSRRLQTRKTRILSTKPYESTKEGPGPTRRVIVIKQKSELIKMSVRELLTNHFSKSSRKIFYKLIIHSFSLFVTRAKQKHQSKMHFPFLTTFFPFNLSVHLCMFLFKSECDFITHTYSAGVGRNRKGLYLSTLQLLARKLFVPTCLHTFNNFPRAEDKLKEEIKFVTRF